MLIRSKAPLRLGLAGGGSDVSPYSDIHGGYVLNVTIDMYAYCSIKESKSGFVEFFAPDINLNVKYKSQKYLPLTGEFDLHKGVYNRIVKDYNGGKPLSFSMTTFSDVPPGSGLGSSSTMVVAIIKAFAEWLSLPLGEYDIAYLAYQIERIDIGLSGGKQDQFAAAFGGFNFMEFFKNDKVIVNPLRVKNWIKDELQASMLLFYTGASRSSADIINQQKANTVNGNIQVIDALHSIKNAALDMKEAVLSGNINKFSDLLGYSWNEKKKTANKISNSNIENIFNIALQNGAISGKVSGAGGGGFIMFMVEPENKYNLSCSLQRIKGQVMNFHFSEGGCHGWKILK